MKIKKVLIKIEPKEKFYGEIKKVFADLDKGRLPSRKPEKVSFESLEDMRKVLTERRLELLRAIKRVQPKSIYELAHAVNRDIKNVRDDLLLLKNVGLVSLKREDAARSIVVPVVQYDRINIAVAI